MGKKRQAAEGHADGKRQKKQKKEEETNGKAKATEPSQIFQPRPDWHAAELPPLPAVEDPKPPNPDVVQALHDHANTLLERECSRYAAANAEKNSSAKFMKELMNTGTLEDKVSALTLVIQESPLHNVKAFESLLSLAGKRSRNHAIMALSALKDLLGAGVVLPPERKLRYFGRQPGLIAALQGKGANWKIGDKLPGEIQEGHLISWAYEDWLKRTYFEVLKLLESWGNDEIEYTRSRAITFIWELLKEKPEQEDNLLRLLVNKLGDREKKVASRASHLLLQLMIAHPAMKSIIIGTIESDLIFRPGQTMHAKYYAIITLNQTILSMKEPEVAAKLLDIYFSIFVSLLKDEKTGNPHESSRKEKIQGGGGKAGKTALRKQRRMQKQQEAAAEQELQLRERLIAQLLSGVNRAYPFADSESKTIEEHLNTLYRVTHSSNFNTGIQALILIQQISTTKHRSADRYYRTLYESLLDPRLISSSKHIMYLNLLYKSLKADLNVKRVQAFAKRLLQIVTLHEPPFVCGVLYLLHELQKTFPSIKSMLTEPESSFDDEEETYVDVPEGDESPSKDTQSALPKPGQSYNPRKRDPEFANADKSCLWELIPIVAHYHPSVSLFASRLLQCEPFDQNKPDPTTFSLIHFLDRFIYRNARTKASGLRGSSIMQPLAGSTTSDLLIKDRAEGFREDALNKEAFWSKKRDEVPADEVFFHEYFDKAGKAQKKSRAEKRASKANKQAGDSTDEEDEDQIWKALVGSRPEIEGAEGDIDEDQDDLDIAELMGEDDDNENTADEDGDENGVSLEGMGDVDFHGFEEDGHEDQDMKDASEASDEDDFDVTVLEDDDEAIFESDEELPEGIELPGKALEEVAKDLKSKDKKKRKKSIKSLPIFATAEDYAKLLGDDDDDGMY
ncbi:uncharacterized protein PV09_02449 [Verruconis gallopava]|uniref:CCAAT-binding factor domain-containing protein n=1 Tax=Verruconis gallopava TaxID=253628 RepID=A0A0D2B691_9PEZI|nr:uncharacterized protein PV09_02449 [Verruconis gallopava]KIW06759.1 hypothetical protein PV09_02449 [Verruconis gallopava]